MAIDYSKWDKIELSDDSDVEVHPNVDKRSFIRWKQQSIHEKRMKRNQDIKNLETQVQMYSALNKRVDKMMSKLHIADLPVTEKVSQFLNANFDKTEKSEGSNVDPDIPTYNEMVEDLLEQLSRDAQREGKDPNDGEVIKDLITKHRSKIDKVTLEAQKKLEELYKEKNAHISSDDIHTGFDSSFINKSTDNSNPADQVMQNWSTSVDRDESGGLVSLPKPPLQFIEYQDDVLKLAEPTREFGEIECQNYQKSKEFLLQHLPIISEQQKDALMMKAFEYELSGETRKAYQVIHQSELLTYIREIYDLKKIPSLNERELNEVIEMFFSKVIFNKANKAGRESFLQSVMTKYEHVKKRSKLMEEEEKNDVGQGVETIQLKSLDDSTELEVNLPDFDSKDSENMVKIEIFKQIPVKMQEALKTKSLEKVNDVFAEMPIDEAEHVLDLFGEADIIGVKALLENEDDFKDLQKEYKNMQNLSIDEQSKLEELEDAKEHISSTVDEVD